MLLLNVPYEEKEQAKALGARWNPERKKWYAQNKQDYPKFHKWILKTNEEECIVLCDYYYIVVGTHTCFKCNGQTPVIGFGVENFYTFYNVETPEEEITHEYNSGEIHIASQLSPLPKEILDLLNRKFNYYHGYSKFTKSYYYGNHCINCNILQGDFYLFNEVDSPFFIDGAEAAKALQLIRVPLSEDLIASCDIGYGSEDSQIKKHATIIQIDDLFQENNGHKE